MREISQIRLLNGKQRDNLMFQACVKAFLWKREVEACSINNASDKLFNNARALTIRVIR